MAIRIISPPASFVTFSDQQRTHPVHGSLDFPLPVVYSSDYAWQWIFAGDTEAETNGVYNLPVTVGIVKDRGDAGFLLAFPDTPTRSKLAPTQILNNWGVGLPGFAGVVGVGECFHVKIQFNGEVWYSNPFKRISVNDEVYYTTVIAYSNDGGGFGFFDCGPAVDPGTGAPVDEDGNCIPTIVDIPNVPNMTIPITQEMRDAYGDLPSVQVWGYDANGNLTNMHISANFIGGYPPTAMYFDFGGPLMGKIRIGK